MAVDASDKLNFRVGAYKKRLLDEYSKSFKILVKKLKVDDGDKKDDIQSSMADTPVLKIKIKKPFQKELPLVEKSVEKVEEKRLQTSLKKDTNKCSRELAHKKVHVKCVKNNEGKKEVESKANEFRIVKRGDSKSFKISAKKLNVEKPFSMIKIQSSQIEEKRLQSLKRDINECSKELAPKLRCVKNINDIHNKVLEKVEECVTNFVEKEAQLYLIEDLIRERKVELENKHMELHKAESKVMEIRRVMDNVDNELKRKEEEFEAISLKIAGCTKELESGRKMLKSQRSQMKDFESKNKKLETREEKLESKERECERQVKELELKEKHFKERVKELETKERKLEGQVKDFESKKEDFEGNMKEFKSKKKHLNTREKKLITKEKQIEEKLIVLESKEKQHEGCLKEFESDKEYFEKSVMELDSEVKELKPKLMHFERLAEDLRSRKHFESREKALMITYGEEKESDNQLSPTIDGSDQTNVLNDIVDNLKASPEPSKDVLDIILHPIVPRSWYRDGDSALVLDKKQIARLEQGLIPDENLANR